jgi:hypothetical protein
MTARKALKELFTPPAWDDLPILMLRPADLTGLISSGFRVPPGGGREHGEREHAEREHAERERKYEEWREIANGLAFHLAALGLAGGVAAAARAAQEFPCFDRTSDSAIDLAAAVLADRAPGWLADFADRHLRLQGQYMLGIPAWPLARKLVRLGAIARPAVPEYTTLLPWGLRCGSFNADGTPAPMLTPAQAPTGCLSKAGQRASPSCALRDTSIVAGCSTPAWTRSAGISPRTGFPGTRRCTGR